MSGTTTLRHLGVIADGNRRWAKEHGVSSLEGHKQGIAAIEALTEAAGEAGIEYVTFYVFSTENWGRSKEEVAGLMRLVETQIRKYAERLAKRSARMLILGSKEGLSTRLLKVLEEAEQITAEGTAMTVCMCFNYGGEQEITDAANAAFQELLDQQNQEIDLSIGFAKQKKKGEKRHFGIDIELDELTPELIRQHLYHPEIPDVDLVVRTSGEQRLSGFMLWRTAYAEFLFLKKYFPEMGKEDIPEIVAEFEKRQRRFGR